MLFMLTFKLLNTTCKVKKVEKRNYKRDLASLFKVYFTLRVREDLIIYVTLRQFYGILS